MNPERIYNWLGTQLSIARHYGGIKYNGDHYTIAYKEEGQPLVRGDVVRRERKQVKLDARREKDKWQQAQQSMFQKDEP